MQKFKTSITISSIESNLLNSLSNLTNIIEDNETTILTFNYEATSRSVGIKYIREHLQAVVPELNIISID